MSAIRTLAMVSYLSLSLWFIFFPIGFCYAVNEGNDTNNLVPESEGKPFCTLFPKYCENENDLDIETRKSLKLYGPGVRTGNNPVEKNYCDIVNDIRNRIENKNENTTLSVNLTDALSNLNLSLAIQYGGGFKFFIYDRNKSISNEVESKNPKGMMVDLLDDLAERAGFAWKNHFIVYDADDSVAMFENNGEAKIDGKLKWDLMLEWATENFDLSVDKWIIQTKRLENNNVFLKPWFDASIIIVESVSTSASNWEFLKVYDKWVWACIGATILLSAVVYQILETLSEHYYHKEEDKSLISMFAENLYLSGMALSSNFVHDKPKSASSRIFLVSFGFWGMLIGATYTANLASIFVGNALNEGTIDLQNAMTNGVSICVHKGSASINIVETRYSNFKTYPKRVNLIKPKDMYAKLEEGSESVINTEQKKCKILIGTLQEFKIFRFREKYGCQLVQTGRPIQTGDAAFAVKFNPFLCDSVVAHILNIHLHDIKVNGNFTDYWNKHYRTNTDTCPNVELTQGELEIIPIEEDTEPLKLSSMLGVFYVHLICICVAFAFGAFEYFQRQQKRKKAVGQNQKKNSPVSSVPSTKQMDKNNLDIQEQYNILISQMDGLRQYVLKMKQQQKPWIETPSSLTSDITPLSKINTMDPIMSTTTTTPYYDSRRRHSMDPIMTTTTTTRIPNNVGSPYYDSRRRHSLPSLNKEERDQEIGYC